MMQINSGGYDKKQALLKISLPFLLTVDFFLSLVLQFIF